MFVFVFSVCYAEHDCFESHNIVNFIGWIKLLTIVKTSKLKKTSDLNNNNLAQGLPVGGII